MVPLSFSTCISDSITTFYFHFRQVFTQFLFCPSYKIQFCIGSPLTTIGNRLFLGTISFGSMCFKFGESACATTTLHITTMATLKWGYFSVQHSQVSNAIRLKRGFAYFVVFFPRFFSFLRLSVELVVSGEASEGSQRK